MYKGFIFIASHEMVDYDGKPREGQRNTYIQTSHIECITQEKNSILITASRISWRVSISLGELMARIEKANA